MVKEQNGHAIFWNGHLCEGHQMAAADANTFILWTRCNLHDVPAGQARELAATDQVTCPACRRFLH
jgi:hypothetical protein